MSQPARRSHLDSKRIQNCLTSPFEVEKVWVCSKEAGLAVDSAPQEGTTSPRHQPFPSGLFSPEPLLDSEGHFPGRAHALKGNTEIQKKILARV